MHTTNNNNNNIRCLYPAINDISHHHHGIIQVKILKKFIFTQFHNRDFNSDIISIEVIDIAIEVQFEVIHFIFNQKLLSLYYHVERKKYD